MDVVGARFLTFGGEDPEIPQKLMRPGVGYGLVGSWLIPMALNPVTPSSPHNTAPAT